jgi:mannose/cellobiose epimerase-like protein (N-acyl-D-glucosamine 2-epimerase family)
MVWRDWAALAESRKREPEIIRSLYPDKAAHDREKRSWELTENH